MTEQDGLPRQFSGTGHNHDNRGFVAVTNCDAPVTLSIVSGSVSCEGQGKNVVKEVSSLGSKEQTRDVVKGDMLITNVGNSNRGTNCYAFHSEPVDW